MNFQGKKIIGGKFGFPEHFSGEPSLPDFLSGDPLLLFNARSGIKLIVDQLKPRRIWLPSYLCPTIITAIDQNISHINFYPISKSLTLVSEEFLSLLQPDDLFLSIDYFGFPFDKSILERVKQRKCKILRDCSQALFFDFKNDELSDFHLFSPRKFLGVPDGGILQIKQSEMKWQNYMAPPPPLETFNVLFKALLLRREFDLFGGDRKWFELFNLADSQFSPQLFSMSQLSNCLLRFAFDYDEIISSRRKNFLTLARRLDDLAIFHDLPEDVTPLGFPIRFIHRTKLQKGLFQKNIYPPVHWIIEKQVPDNFNESHFLSDQILTLPCDQRYIPQDMEFLANEVLDIIRTD